MIYIKKIKRFLNTSGKCIKFDNYKWSEINKILENLDYFDQKIQKESVGRYLDERIIEYPYVFNELINLENKRILDAGSALNFEICIKNPIIRRNKLSIMTLSHEKNNFCNLNVDYIYGDLRKTFFKDETFDVIVSISTIEHIGLDNSILYTKDMTFKEREENNFLEAIMEFKRILKSNGKCIITVPCGRRMNLKWLQIFDEEMIEAIIKEFEPKNYRLEYFQNSDIGWSKKNNFTDVQNAKYSSKIVDQNIYKFNLDMPGAEAIACITMVK